MGGGVAHLLFFRTQVIWCYFERLESRMALLIGIQLWKYTGRVILGLLIFILPFLLTLCTWLNLTCLLALNNTLKLLQLPNSRLLILLIVLALLMVHVANILQGSLQ